MVFGVDDLGADGEKGFFDFSLEGAFGSEESNFNELLGDGGTALEFVLKEDVFEGTGDTLNGETKVGVEVLIFDSDGGLANVRGEGVEVDGSAVLVGVDFVERFSVAIHDDGGDRKGDAGEFVGRRKVTKEKEKNGGESDQGSEKEKEDDFEAERYGAVNGGEVGDELR